MQSSDFVNHSYDYRPNWNPLSPVTITNNLYVYLALSFKGGKILPDWYENLWRPVGFTTIFLKGILR